MTKGDEFLQIFTSALIDNQPHKISIGNKRNKTDELQNVFIKPVLIQNNLQVSFVYRYATKDVTQNYEASKAVNLLRILLQRNFFNADLFTQSHTFYYTVGTDGKEKLIKKSMAVIPSAPVLTHDKQKNRIINSDAFYLKQLGITGAEGRVKKEMQHKFKQINRYVEIIEGILKNTEIKNGFKVVDMGSGKGYLTFALYDYLQNNYAGAEVLGVEMRDDLVEKCNHIAETAGYDKLGFKKGTIADAELTGADMLIALHACDTATDDAIAKGIKAGAKIIICAPCCHKQIRKQIAPVNALQHITKHGILSERQAEMVTDTIRALILEAYGYKTKVFDFIEEEHTPKNVLIVGIRRAASEQLFAENIQKVQAVKDLFGIKKHYLEGLM